MKIAFATQDKQRVDAHFGWAKHLAIYDVTPTTINFVETFHFGEGVHTMTSASAHSEGKARPSRSPAPSLPRFETLDRTHAAGWSR